MADPSRIEGQFLLSPGLCSAERKMGSSPQGQAKGTTQGLGAGNYPRAGGGLTEASGQIQERAGSGGSEYPQSQHSGR